MLGYAGWTVTCLLPVYSIWAGMVYFGAEARSFQPDADSAILPIGSTAMVALLVTVAMSAINAVGFRQGRGRGRFLAWDRRRPLWSFVVTAFWMTPALGLAWISASDLTALGRQPPIELIWSPIPPALVVWLLRLRAATLTPGVAPQSNSSPL